MANNDGGPAFPTAGVRREFHRDDDLSNWEHGMTLRDWFAGQALNGLLSDSEVNFDEDGDYAWQAYKLADAMLEARARPTPEPEKP